MMMKLLRWGNIGWVLLTLLCYLAPYVSPLVFWPLAFLPLAFPWLILGHLLFLAFWASLRRYQVLLSLACLLLSWPYLTNFIGFNLPSGKAADFRVKSFNAYSFRTPGEPARAYEAEDLPELFSIEGIDVLCFQEFPAQTNRKVFAHYFKQEAGLPYHNLEASGAMVIFSRYPIKASESHYFVKHFNGFQWADLEIDGKMLRLFNLHLQSNAVSGLVDEVSTEGQLKDRKTWLNIGGMAKRFRRAARLRATQAEEVAEAMRQSPHPVLLCGDFNAVPLSYTYRVLSEGLEDAFQQAGTGWGATYAGPIPALRIDYLLYSPELRPLRYRTVKEPCSDHYAVESGFSWKE